LGQKAIEPEQSQGWTINEMVGLGGVCLYAVMSCGPLLKKMKSVQQGKTFEPQETAEHKEAEQELVHNDATATIEFVGYLTMLLREEKYDDSFEPCARCGVTQESDVHRRVIPIEGIK